MASKVAESTQGQDQFDTIYYINSEYPGKGNIAWDRFVTTAESQGFTAPSKSTLEALAGRIGQTMQKKNIDDIGSPCSGVIDRGYLDVGQILTNALYDFQYRLQLPQLHFLMGQFSIQLVLIHYLLLFLIASLVDMILLQL